MAWVAQTVAAMTVCGLAGLPRTSTDAELRCEREQRRSRAMPSSWMRTGGAQGWHRLWQVSANWEPTQVRQARQRRSQQPPGAAVLARGGRCLAGVTWLDALVV